MGLRKEEVKRLGILLIVGGMVTPFSLLIESWLHRIFVYDVQYLLPLLPHGIVTAIAGVIVLAAGLAMKEEPTTSIIKNKQ